MKQESRTNINRVKKDISSPDSFTPPEELKRQLITTMQSIYDEEDIEAVERAYKVAYKAHEKQKRKSGEPYIIHPICVAIILAELELDKETIMAGLLHDVVEDTETTHEDIVRDFGEEVAQLVDGVTKLGQLSYSKDKIEVQAENLRKMFLAMAKDIRVILIKLADRLHNMRTMQFMRPEKQKEKSRETMDIYAPIAHRLGISKIKVELDDLALRYLKPDVYEDLERSLDSAKEEREAFIQEIVDEVKGHIDHAGIKDRIDARTFDISERCRINDLLPGRCLDKIIHTGRYNPRQNQCYNNHRKNNNKGMREIHHFDRLNPACFLSIHHETPFTAVPLPSSINIRLKRYIRGTTLLTEAHSCGVWFLPPLTAPKQSTATAPASAAQFASDAPPTDLVISVFPNSP